MRDQCYLSAKCVLFSEAAAAVASATGILHVAASLRMLMVRPGNFATEPWYRTYHSPQCQPDDRHSASLMIDTVRGATSRVTRPRHQTEAPLGLGGSICSRNIALRTQPSNAGSSV